MDYIVMIQRLLAGENSEVIAKELADSLNQAVKEVNERKEAEKKALEAKNRKKEDLLNLWELFKEWVLTYEADNKYLCDVVNEEIDADELIDIVENTTLTLGKINDVVENCKDEFDVIGKFLADNGLI